MSTQKLSLSPASIMVAYVIRILDKMTDPSDKADWPLYTSNLPDIKNDCGMIHGTPGTNDPRSMNGTMSGHPGIQLRIRAKNSETGFAKIEDIAVALDAVVRDTIVIGSSTYRIQNVSRTSPIVELGVEPGTKRRFAFTVNFLLTIEKLN